MASSTTTSESTTRSTESRSEGLPPGRSRGRACRLRRCFVSAPTSSRLRPHARPLHRARAWLTARRPVPRPPRPGPCTRSRVGAHIRDAWACARAGKSQSAPSSRLPARRSSRRHRRTRVPAAARTRARLHPRKRRQTVDAPMPRRLARKCLQQRGRWSPCARIGRHGMVAAWWKAATTAHGPSATIVQNTSARAPRRWRPRSVHAGPVGTPRPPFPPPRPSPLDPPTWAPPWRSLAARAR
jgi:hypothetical protein